MHQSKWCHCPLHHCCKLCTTEHISGIVSFHWWFPVVLRIKGTELCMSGPVCAPVTPPTHMESLLPRHGCCLHLPGTAPCSLLLHFSWCSSLPNGLHICCLSLPTEHKPPSACILLGLFLAVSPASGAAVAQQNMAQWGSAEWTCCWNLLLTSSPKRKTSHF